MDCPGGTGALLGLVIFMLLRSRSQQMKQLGKIAAPGALFNISEPMVFGIPLVMNPYFFLPFILTPVLLVIVSYTAMATGLVAPPAESRCRSPRRSSSAAIWRPEGISPARCCRW